MTKATNLTVLKSAVLALFFFLAALAAPAFVAQAASISKTMQFATEPLTIETARGTTQTFTVELAVTDAQREHGLMFRKAMPADHGMLFDFGTVRRVMMWMENTPLPLDMLFLDANGKIINISENAVPYSETIIDSGQPVKYVIELNGGIVKKLGLALGDKVSSATITKGLGK